MQEIGTQQKSWQRIDKILLGCLIFVIIGAVGFDQWTTALLDNPHLVVCHDWLCKLARAQ